MSDETHPGLATLPSTIMQHCSHEAVAHTKCVQS